MDGARERASPRNGECGTNADIAGKGEGMFAKVNGLGKKDGELKTICVCLVECG